MFRRILVPVDFTPRSLRAVRAAAKVAATTRAKTTLLHVIERIDDGESGAFESFYRKLESAAREKVKALVAPFGERLPVRAEILYGKPVGEILRFAQANRIDLIVMSSHKLPLRHSGESWGTVSYKVGILSRCPVLLVK
ncbi:MAG TPA: universal stress protein [Thermoanaerobaculia bacterium]